MAGQWLAEQEAKASTKKRLLEKGEIILDLERRLQELCNKVVVRLD